MKIFVLVLGGLTVLCLGGCGGTVNDSPDLTDGGGQSGNGGTGGFDGGGGGQAGGTAGAAGAVGTSCKDLGLHDCRLRSDCVADLCYECSCTPVFMGCHDPSTPAASCPGLGCPQPQCCTDSCSNGMMCLSPGMSAGCGACNNSPGNCEADPDCSKGQICAPVACSCNSQSSCQSGCGTDGTACGLGTTCSGGDHPRCVASSCSNASACPEDFDCTQGKCSRRSCTSNLVCDGFCVKGQCFDSEGSCSYPPA